MCVDIHTCMHVVTYVETRDHDMSRSSIYAHTYIHTDIHTYIYIYTYVATYMKQVPSTPPEGGIPISRPLSGHYLPTWIWPLSSHYLPTWIWPLSGYYLPTWIWPLSGHYLPNLWGGAHNHTCHLRISKRFLSVSMRTLIHSMYVPRYALVSICIWYHRSVQTFLHLKDVCNMCFYSHAYALRPWSLSHDQKNVTYGLVSF